MNAKKVIRDYIGPRKANRIIKWILAVLAVALLGIGIAMRLNGPAKDDAVQFDPAVSQEGDYVWVDIAGVSEEISVYSGGSKYYIVIDGTGSYRFVILGNLQYENMLTQRAYWSGGKYSELGATVRAYGTVQEAPEWLFARAGRHCGLKGDEVSALTGTVVVNTGKQPTDNLGALPMWAGIFLGLFWVFYVVKTSGINKYTRESIRRLEKLGQLENAAAELTSESCLKIDDDRSRLGEHFAFGRRSGAAVFYDDVAWTFLFPVRAANGTPMSLDVVTNTRSGLSLTPVSVSVRKPEAIALQANTHISDRCANALIGYGEENRKEYRAMVREYKKSNKK